MAALDLSTELRDNSSWHCLKREEKIGCHTPAVCGCFVLRHCVCSSVVTCRSCLHSAIWSESHMQQSFFPKKVNSFRMFAHFFPCCQITSPATKNAQEKNLSRIMQTALCFYHRDFFFNRESFILAFTTFMWPSLPQNIEINKPLKTSKLLKVT